VDRQIRITLGALALLLCIAACGSGVVFISFNAGTILTNPHCQNSTGQFNMLNTGGLTLIIIINSGTNIILANGRPGTCTDLAANTSVQVRGPQNGSTVTAQSVQVQ
jgi:hypothetical protein